MSFDSRIPGFFRKSISERIDSLVETGGLDTESARLLKSGLPLLPTDRADRMIENVIGTFGLPFAVVGNFIVDGRDRLVPMVVEEPSIVAGLSGAAKLARHGGGFVSHCDEYLLAGQIQLVDVADPEAACKAILSARDKLLAEADRSLERLVQRGGGARDLDCRIVELADGSRSVVVHVYLDTCDAMGANLVNTVCEALAPRIEERVAGRAVLRILSNLADRAVVTSTVRFPLETLRAQGFEADEVRDGIVLAAGLAVADPYRATTHNKGVMNGIDAVAIATGNDWRAIEAAAHAYAARDGSYRSLTRWKVGPTGDLVGEIAVPLKVGIVGGSLRANPGVEVGLEIADAETALDLAKLMAAVGLAQNFAALRALVTHGIQRGHMRLHARSVASTAGVPPHLFDKVVAGLIDSGEIKTWKAEELMQAIEAPEQDERAVPASGTTGHGAAAAKVILLGEHAAVYDKHVLALPLEAAVNATITRSGAGLEFDFVELGRRKDIDLKASAGPGAGIASALELIMRELGIEDRGFHVQVESRVPAAMGLGSSAAFAVAIVRALADLLALDLPVDRVNEIAFACEKLAHGTPSGIDNTLAAYARPVLYRKSAKPPTRQLSLPESPPIVVASSGKPGITREQVAGVKSRAEQSPGFFAKIFDEIDAISLAGADALQAADYDKLGALMNLCHGYLNAIGVSTPELETMVGIARDAGAVGAKLTGAGGGGSIVALCPGREDAVADALLMQGYDIILSSI